MPPECAQCRSKLAWKPPASEGASAPAETAQQASGPDEATVMMWQHQLRFARLRRL